MLHEKLTSLDAIFGGRNTAAEWFAALRKRATPLVNLTVTRTPLDFTNLPREFHKVACSHSIAKTLKKLQFKSTKFDKVASINFSKMLPFFVNLETLHFSGCRFVGPVGKAIRHSFRIRTVYWDFYLLDDELDLVRAFDAQIPTSSVSYHYLDVWDFGMLSAKMQVVLVNTLC